MFMQFASCNYSWESLWESLDSIIFTRGWTKRDLLASQHVHRVHIYTGAMVEHFILVGVVHPSSTPALPAPTTIPNIESTQTSISSGSGGY